MKKSGTFDKELVMAQVKSLGLLENVKVRRAGFVARIPYKDFLRRYKTIGAFKVNQRLDVQDSVISLLQHLKIGAGEFALGKTKLFIKRPNILFDLESRRIAEFPRVATIMQRAWRHHHARVQFRKAISVIRIAKAYRRYKLGAYIGGLSAALRKLQHSRFDRKLLVSLPVAPRALDQFFRVTTQLWLRWKASRVLLALPKEGREQIRIKCNVLSIIDHNKKKWDINRKFEQRYIDETLMAEVKNILLKNKEDNQIIFCDYVTKLSGNSKVVPRLLIVTQTAFYVVERTKPFDSKRPARLLNTLRHISFDDAAGATITIRNLSEKGDLDETVLIFDDENSDKVVELTAILLAPKTFNAANFVPNSACKLEIVSNGTDIGYGGKKGKLLTDSEGNVSVAIGNNVKLIRAKSNGGVHRSNAALAA